jgi:hypothetical protein
LKQGGLSRQALELLFPKLDLSAKLPHREHGSLTVGKAIGLFPKAQYLESTFKEQAIAHYELPVAEELIVELSDAKSSVAKTNKTQSEFIDNRGGWYNYKEKVWCPEAGFQYNETLWNSGLISKELKETRTKYNSELERQWAVQNGECDQECDSGEDRIIEMWQGEAAYTIDTRLKAMAFKEGWIRIDIRKDNLEVEGSKNALTESAVVIKELGEAYGARYGMVVPTKLVTQDLLIDAVDHIMKEEEVQQCFVSAIESPGSFESKISRYTEARLIQERREAKRREHSR